MLKIYNSSHNYNNIDIMASIVLLTHSWLTLIDMPLFTMCVVTCVETPNTEVFGTGSCIIVFSVGSCVSPRTSCLRVVPRIENNLTLEFLF
jgi:hypothetical protein